jgi:phosphate-selective porin OprO/OprP
MKKNTFIILLFISGYFFAQSPVSDIVKPSIAVGGRIMFDYEFLEAGDYSVNGNEFRRVRLHAKGKVSNKINYKVEFDFAKGEPAFRDIYIEFKLPKNIGSLKIGSFTEPTSLDNMTSSNNITFFERSMMSNTQPFKYNAGLLFENYNLFEKGFTLQVAHTYNGDKELGFKDTNLENGSNWIARVTKAFLTNTDKNQLLHLGLNFENRQNNNPVYKYKFRFENHLGDKFLVSPTGVFKNTNDLGFELAGAYKSFTFQSEFESSKITTDIDNYETIGYYVSGSYFLTGEHKIYKKGAFKGTKPIKNIDNGGFGAIELVARYSVMDFANFPFSTPDSKIENITVGFNVYLNKYSRIMYNYTNTNFNDINLYNTHNLSGHLIRFQINF